VFIRSDVQYYSNQTGWRCIGGVEV
jgi:hypothetical protein